MLVYVSSESIVIALGRIVLGAFVDVSVGKEASSFPYTNNNKSAQHFPTLKIDFYFLYTECGGLVCLFVCLVFDMLYGGARANFTHTHSPCTLTYFRVGWTGICMYVHGEV